MKTYYANLYENINVSPNVIVVMEANFIEFNDCWRIHFT